MIRAGKEAGWLTSPHPSLTTWMLQNGVELDGVAVEAVPSEADKGSGLIARRELSAEDHGCLVTVPRRLIVCKESVKLHSKTDAHLKEVLEALGDFGTTSRGAILIFLLMQASFSCPATEGKIGCASPFADYIKYLPLEELPTFWPEDKLRQLAGTSLAPAVEAKLKSLHREYSDLQEATSKIDWCNKFWWDRDSGFLTFDDWLQVDAMYRSRALEFPGVGDSMVPCIDMANHSSGDQTVAIYETDADGNAVLLLRDGKSLRKGDEVTITYGDDKGACEMIFSYGFIEKHITTARHVFLELDIPLDDPLRYAKKAISNSPPGVRVSDGESGNKWDSDFVWLICVNEEDGLHFQIKESQTPGDQELTVRWQEQPLSDTSRLRSLLESAPLWPVYRLRAVAILQDRLETQLDTLAQAHQIHKRQEGSDVAEKPQDNSTLATRLRYLEARLLQQVAEDLDAEKHELLQSEIVINYLEDNADM